MKNKFYFLLITLCTVFAKSQVKEDLRYFLDKATISIYNNPEKSLVLIQNLMTNDKNPDNQIIYRNLIAQSYSFKGDYLNAAKSSLGKEDYNQINSPFHQFYLNYAFADQYQNLGLFDQSKNSINRALALQKFPENAATQITVGKFFQLQAINYSVSKKYEDALKFLKKSDSVLIQSYTEVEILKTENALFRVSIFTNQQRFPEAKAIYDKVLKSKILSQSTFLYAYARQSAANLSFLQRDNEKTILLLTEALKKIGGEEYAELKNKIYEDLAKVHLAQNNHFQYHHYRKLSEDLTAQLLANKKAAINYVIDANERINSEEILVHQIKSRNEILLCSFSGGILILVLLSFYLNTARKERDLKKQEEFFENLLSRKRNKNLAVPAENLEIKTVEESISKKISLLSPKKENELLEKLQIFEDSKLYLNKQMSLPILASELETNIKYLSEIIREKKNTKFNSYINNLRIEYIVNQLQSDPLYLQFKVSHLAEITGFSSHSAFTSVFKGITGISPNEFITQLTEAKK